MKYTIQDKVLEVWLEKEFESPPENYSELFYIPLSHRQKIECGIWEEKECVVEYNHFIETYFEEEIPCKHFVKIFEMIVHGYNKSKPYSEFFGYYPKVLIAYNEGHCATTGICLDCLLEMYKEK